MVTIDVSNKGDTGREVTQWGSSVGLETKKVTSRRPSYMVIHRSIDLFTYSVQIRLYLETFSCKSVRYKLDL